MENVLKVENLKYKDVLNNITFSLKEKSFNVLVGANGSGKTTFVNCIRGLVDYQGFIALFNTQINKQNNFDLIKEVGFFMNEEILLEDTVFEELLSLLKNLDYEEEKAKKRIYSLAKKLDLTQILFKKESELLMYEVVLVSFMFSIIHEPKLLIIDNDLENLDETYKNKIFEYLKKQKKLTILFITTNSEYFYDVDNILFLKDGKISLLDTFDNFIKEEKTFIKCGSNLPFNIDLSNKLISYGLLESIEYDTEKMVNEVWK